MPVPYIVICGSSGSGKTTLIEGLLAELRRRGYRAGVLKHTSQKPQMDREGKDTWRFRQAGAGQVGIVSGGEIWVYRQVDESAGIEACLELFQGLDLVIVEGYKRAPCAKIEVTAGAGPDSLACRDDPHLVAVAGVEAMDCGVPFFSRDDHRGIAGFIIAQILEEGPSGPARSCV